MTKLKALTKCLGGGCPTIYEMNDSDDLIVQGYVSTAQPTPEGEALVRIPRHLLDEVQQPTQ